MTSLRQRMTEDMQVRNLALNTQMSYVQQVSLFARHFNKSPEQLGPEDIRAYQVYLTNERSWHLDPCSSRWPHCAFSTRSV
jgi:integrase/recombinase XerD